MKLIKIIIIKFKVKMKQNPKIEMHIIVFKYRDECV